MATWTRKETLKLIELWSSEDIQAQLEGCKRNKLVFEKIASEMRKEGFERTFQQCREKTKKLRQEYKKIKDKLRETGQEGRQYLISKFEYFEVLDKIFGNKPATQPKVIIDSMAGITTVDSEISDSDDSVMPKESDPDYPGTSSTATVDNDDDNQNNTSCDVTDGNSKKDVKPLVSGKKKRRRQIEVLQDTMKGMTNEVVEAQKASDQLFAQLEEKRMKMEEAQQEREAKMRRDDQEFQMRVFQLLTGGTGYPMVQSPAPVFPPYSGH